VTTNSTNPLILARRKDSERRRGRILNTLERFRADGHEITVSAVARAAGVDRSFLYRHNDLRTQVLAAADEPEPPSSSSTRTSRRSLLADLANLRAQNERLRHQNTKLSERLSEVLGEQVFHDAGITRTDEIGTLRQRVAELEQQLLELRQDLQDRDDELAAARAANRDLMTTLSANLG
jgi:cell division protein FtsB